MLAQDNVMVAKTAITSINNIVIKTDTLNYCFSDLIEKISMDFDISHYEAKKLIEWGIIYEFA